MPQLIVEVKDRIATGNKERIVCGNSDYTIKFIFDEMWDAYPAKTALYKWGENFKESERVPFDGDICRVPQMFNTNCFKVGVFAGDLRSTTPAYFGADECILCNTKEQESPTPDVYNEIMELINKKADGVNPVEKTPDMTQPVGVDPDGKLFTIPGGSGIEVSDASVGQIIKISEVDDSGKPIAWEPVDIPKEFSGKWEDITGKPDELDAIFLVTAMDFVSPMVDNNGCIYIDENGNVYTL